MKTLGLKRFRPSDRASIGLLLRARAKRHSPPSSKSRAAKRKSLHRRIDLGGRKAISIQFEK